MILEVYTEAIPKDIINEVKKFDSEEIYHYLTDPFTFNVGIVSDDSGDKILGTGIIRVVNEFKIILNNDLSNMMRAKIIKLLFEGMITLAQCNEAIALLTIPKDDEIGMEQYKSVLEKHFKFYHNVGVLMRLEK